MADEPLKPEQVLAQAIRYHREVRLRWTAQQLADRIQELGGDLFRQAISKIENGRRAVSIDELMYLARAMKMSPLLLLFPAGTHTERIPADVEVAGQAMPMWDAARWFSGEGYPAEDVTQHWGVPLYLHREHDRRIGELAQAIANGLFATGGERYAEERAEAEKEVRRVRAEMRRHGLTPPPLEAGLEYLDEKPTAALQQIRGEVERQQPDE